MYILIFFLLYLIGRYMFNTVREGYSSEVDTKWITNYMSEDINQIVTENEEALAEEEEEEGEEKENKGRKKGKKKKKKKN